MNHRSLATALRSSRITAVMLSLCGFVALLILAMGRPAQATAPRTVTETVQRGVNYLTPDVVMFDQDNQCQACHRQGGALAALGTANSTGYTVDNTDESGTGLLAAAIALRDQWQGLWGGNNETDSWAFFGLAGYDRNISTRYSQNLVAAADAVLGKPLSQQSLTGPWYSDSNNYPVNYSHVGTTARFLVGLAEAKQRVAPATAAAYQARMDLAAGWIRANKGNISTDQDGLGLCAEMSWAIIGLRAAGAAADDADVIFLRDRLIGAMSSDVVDGQQVGWGEIEGDSANEFDTGLALFAMSQAGVELRDNPAVAATALWLRDRQIDHVPTNGGYWSAPAFSSFDIPTTFAVLGLSAYGELGVRLNPTGPTSLMVLDSEPLRQTVQYQLQVQNHGAFDVVDTYSLSVQGGLPGWTAVISNSTVTLASGSSLPVTVTVSAPPNLPEALPVEMSVVARSQTNPAITATLKLVTYTPPLPPVVGLDTETTLLSGDGATVTSRSQNVTLSASVVDVNSAQVVGPGKGVMTFSVAGIPVGADSDTDGDGVFSVVWQPGGGWSALGVQDVRAVYSGIDNPGHQPDLLGSVAAGNLTVTLPVNQAPTADAGVDRDADTNGATAVVSLSGSGSTDPDGDALDYQWTEGMASLGSGVSLSRSFAVGVHTVALTVTDEGGLSSTDTVTVTVTNTPLPPVLQSVQVLSPVQVKLVWTDKSAAEGSFVVEAKPAGGSFSAVQNVVVNGTTASPYGLTPDTDYTFRIKAVNTRGAGISNELTAHTQAAPAAPTNLAATVLSPTQVRLSWQSGDPTTCYFRVERLKDGDAGFSQMTVLGKTVLTWTDGSASAATTYQYRVKAVNGSALTDPRMYADGPPSNVVTVQTTLPPAAPTNLAAAVLSATQIRLTWQNSDANTSYFRIERQKEGDAGFTQATVLGKTVFAWTDSGLSPATTYTYQVRGLAGTSYTDPKLYVASSPSTPASAKTTGPPAPPTAVTATALSATQIRVAWQSGDASTTYFRVERKGPGDADYVQAVVLGSTTLAWGDANLTPNTAYSYRVRGLAGSSYTDPRLYVAGDASTPASATTLDTPAAPSGLTVTALAGGQAKLVWRDNAASETEYQVERSATGVDGSWSVIAHTAKNAVSYQDRGLTGGQTVYYRVRAASGTVYSGYSGSVSTVALP